MLPRGPGWKGPSAGQQREEVECLRCLGRPEVEYPCCLALLTHHCLQGDLSKPKHVSLQPQVAGGILQAPGPYA